MDNQLQTFMELSALPVLAELAGDRRAAWVWSADGSRILWANAAGAAFFSVREASSLARLDGLARSPARPHIARIATSGSIEKPSIDRLRFYRGLRVLLLTCQCQRLQLEDGHDAALVICADKGLALAEAALPAFAALVSGSGRTAILQDASGAVLERKGELTGSPEYLDLPEDQRILSGPLELDGGYHESTILVIDAQTRLVLLSNEVLEMDEPEAEDDAEDADTLETISKILAAAELKIAETGTPDPVIEPVPATETELPPIAAAFEAQDAGSRWARAEDLDEAEAEALPGMALEPDAEASVQDEVPAEEQLGQDVETANPGIIAELPELPEEETVEEFRFIARRRPVRFAWKMDIDQRFTFISDEFIDTLGPGAADIVGKTWADVSSAFDLDPAGSIARSLDRRDTWSGKTVDWPVTGMALRVPVDMAALPGFDRDRRFEGYRGFGVCRTADAIEDPLAPLLPLIAETGDLNLAGPEITLQPEAIDFGAPTGEAVAEAALSLLESDAVSADETPSETLGTEPVEAVIIPAEEALSGETPAEEVATTEIDEVVPETTGGLQAFEEPTPEAAPVDEEPASALEPALDQPDSENQTEVGAAQDLAMAGAQVTEPQPVVSPVAPSEPEISSDGSDAAADMAPEDEGPAEAFQALEAEPVEPAIAAEENAVPEPKADLAPEPVSAPEVEAEPSTTEAPAQAEELTEVEEDAAFESLDNEPALAAAEIIEPNAEAETEAETETEAEVEPVAQAEPSPEAKPEEQPDLTPQPKQPLAGGTLIGASAAALLNGLSLKTSRPAAPVQQATEQDLFPRDEAAPVTERKTAATETATEPQSSAAPSQQAEEPVGISGSALLHPSEIETAVRTLAKNYGRKPQETLPLTAPSEPDAPSEEAAEKAAPLTNAPAAQDISSPAETRTGNDNLRHDNDAREDDADLFPTDSAGEDQSASSTPDDEDSKVIHLVGRRPRVVPVDTSRLSRPERAAFRKIAEALGARLEGDMEEGREDEAPDQELEQELARFNAPPQAGPIDPRLLDRLPIGIAIAHDRDVLYANDTLLAMLGYKTLAALADAGGLEAMFVEDDDSFPDAERMEGTVDDTLKVRLAGGGLRAVDARMHSVPWNGGSGLMISITERPAPAAPAAAPAVAPADTAALKKAQDQVAELDTILETATDGVLVLDRHGTITKVNRSAEALFSANRVDMEGAPLTEFLAPESHRSAADYLDGLMRNGVASILNDGREVLGRVSSGGLIPLFMTVGRISGNGGEPKFCAVLRDITQWKTAEEELTQAKRQAENASSQKSDFLAKISHEIRTPLNAIIGFSEVMIEERFGTIGNDRYKEYLKDIRTSGSHIMSLVNDLLDLSKIEAGKMDLRFSAVSPNEVMSECVALMQPQANRERVIIRASLPDSVPSIVVDQRSLRQIMLNLLSNAIKFNKSGGQVIISSALEDTGEVILRVRDTGTGMSPQDLSAALEPFRQVHTSRYGGGTGLGLPLTKALVEANRASFRIDSTPDQGTLVEIRFPSQRVLAE
ncbi:ATP-binding protein [Roseibium suaedae]|uniref:histidine kinase n=1 Tax=Roseibium suaedae TaxID=735517 RepID=A0A1M7AG49_9HYPH|nr:ATP-binding protein [Roseibium suaedae]SHL41586.1 PAS domain S-box-containing protein [Roseibium suaedae]